MSIYEIMLIADSYLEKKRMEDKEKLSLNYTLAQNIAIAVLYRMDGKAVPSLYETYPDLFEEELAQQKQDGPQPWELYKEQMLDFANLHNKKRQKEG